MKKIICLAAVAAMVLCSCSQEGWSNEELDIIRNQGEVMRVLTVRDQQDSAVLRKISTDIPAKALHGEDYRILSRKMIATVTSPEQDGVGIAGPQVGISHRVVAVQRFDKEGEPFEVYPNIRILAKRGEPQLGPEGCLSVPDCRGDVLRYREIDIRYTALPSGKDTTETVKGFTAVIFQHECDHLDGILYTDYLN
ncbi:MAG: peptide deformylase [Candidatus Cryptobacteroides sp.]